MWKFFVGDKTGYNVSKQGLWRRQPGQSGIYEKPSCDQQYDFTSDYHAEIVIDVSYI